MIPGSLVVCPKYLMVTKLSGMTHVIVSCVVGRFFHLYKRDSSLTKRGDVCGGGDLEGIVGNEVQEKHLAAKYEGYPKLLNLRKLSKVVKK